MSAPLLGVCTLWKCYPFFYWDTENGPTEIFKALFGKCDNFLSRKYQEYFDVMCTRPIKIGTNIWRKKAIILGNRKATG